jgi:Zn finger protein HypA/HybF involved in hydrogenase expression
MHEVSLVHALFDQTDRAIAPHPTTAVRQVTVCLGELAGVERELFRTAFEACKGERGYPSAALDIVVEGAEWRCAECAAPILAGGPLRCTTCDGRGRLCAGGELILQRLELEVSDV